MIVLGVLYPQFWGSMDPNEGKERFYFQLGVLKLTFCVCCKVDESRQIVLALFLGQTLML
jgi:hypothetical protein